MPRDHQRLCRRLGCTNPEPCPVHGRPHLVQLKELRRGGPKQRGYTSSWRWYRNFWFGRVWDKTKSNSCGCRLPGAPLTTDSVCAQAGRTTLAKVLDHIVPVTSADDPKFYDEYNLQGLCDACHNAKRAREQKGGMWV